MSIFKKIFSKKKNEVDITELLEKVTPPKVIKESKIKPTKCKACLTIYQAKHNHIRSERDIGFIHPKYNLFAECPICHNLNVVEFEEDADD